jgi:anti-sigma-K factor RskA
MAQDEHTPYIENIPAYAIGTLDADDVIALEKHLQNCASCRTELAEYRAMSYYLLIAIPPKQPSAALRKRLQSQLPSAQKKSRLPNLSFGRLALGFAVIILVVLNITSLMQIRAIQNQQIALLNQVDGAQVALALMSSPNAQILPLAGDIAVSGTLLLDEQNNTAVLIVRNLPQLGDENIYQIWLVEENGGRVSAGLFRPESGQTYTTRAILPSQSLADYLGIGVTVEPAGGSVAPTGERVFKVDF